jgi:hypothetical protein
VASINFADWQLWRGLKWDRPVATVAGAETVLRHGGVELTAVRDNLRHASLATTSMYLHTDDVRRAKQVTDRFAVPRS